MTSFSHDRPVEADPFWSVVRRRHPDLDLVLLPPEAAESAAAAPPLAPVADVDAEAARFDDRATGLWRRLVDAEPPPAQTRWLAGDSRDAVRREVRFTREGADPVEDTVALRAAAETLRAEGWRVLAPPDGMPRVLASHDADGRIGHIGREELQLLLVPGTGRLVLRVRSAGIPVGRRTAHTLLTGPP